MQICPDLPMEGKRKKRREERVNLYGDKAHALVEEEERRGEFIWDKTHVRVDEEIVSLFSVACVVWLLCEQFRNCFHFSSILGSPPSSEYWAHGKLMRIIQQVI